MAAKSNFGNFVSDKPELSAHFSEKLDIAASIFPECETLAQIDLFRMKAIMDYRV